MKATVECDLKKKISVMIPCYNEEENVRQICEAVRGIIKKDCPAYDYEILFIDNKSHDRTREILRELCREDKNVKAIFNVTNFGQFKSPYYGLLQTTGDCTIGMCCDFQDPPEMIPRFVREWEKGYKIVIGVKSKSKENPLLYLMRGFYYKTIRKLSRCDQIEQFTGFGLYDKSFIQTLRELHDPQPFIRGIVAELGPERREIEYTQQKRRAGKTHNNFFSLYDGAMEGFTSYTKAGLRLATFIGFIVAGFSFLIGIVYLILKLLWWNDFSAGSAPATIGQFFLGGIQLAFMGFLGEYVMAINARVMNRPLVVEEERLNFTDSAIPEEKDIIEKIYSARLMLREGKGAEEIAAATGLSREQTALICEEESKLG
ncbi:MAG: glycosyltransferase family 2 protein [Ruminococcus sp.]|nr:glycosyltransferase family 2 protein [Ruminococcus sp.]